MTDIGLIASGERQNPLIYGSPVSSFTRKVLLALEYKGIPHTIDMPDMSVFKQLNPLGKMPIMAIGDAIIIDSSVICDFLERRYLETPPLYPTDIFLRARALWLEEYIDTALQASIYPFVNEVLFKPNLYGQPSDPKIVEESLIPIGERLDYLEQEFSGGSFVEGGFGIVEITLLAVLGNPLRAGLSIDPARWPRLSPYIQHLLASDLMVEHAARHEEHRSSLEKQASARS